MATWKFQYAVIDQGGQPGPVLPVEAKTDRLPGVAMAAAEDFHAKPEAAGATWPLVFVIYNRKGEELVRHTVKMWNLPCFLTIYPEGLRPARGRRSWLR